MNINLAWPSAAQWTAAGRHAVSYAAGAVTGAAGILTFAVTFHFISADQSSQITGALTSISGGVKAVVDGVTSITGGVAALVAIASGAWAVWSRTHKAQTVAAAAVPGTTIITNPAMAASISAPNVVSSATNVVKPAGAP